jgi:hypothetical protein
LQNNANIIEVCNVQFMKASHFKINKVCWRNIRVFCLLVLAVSITSIGVIAGYVLQSESIPLEVKEPIELIGYPTAFSLFPGETEEFNVTVQNTASINYSVTLMCSLNDTEYQAKYVIFSSEDYTVNPGTQTLAAWLTVSSDAPAGNFLVSVNLTRRSLSGEQPAPSPSPSSTTEAPLTPCELLLEGGAKWAANNSGGSALFINWKDNWNAHHLTDGADWGPWPSESSMDNSRSSIAQILGQAGFEVHFAGDIPQNLSGYNLMVVEAYYAVESRHNALLRDYLASGGGVVILRGVPCYFSVDCKDMWPYRFGGMDLTSLQDWFGCRYYVNTGGTARATVNNPFDTAILINDTLVTTDGYSAAAVSTPSNSTQVIALWDGGAIFAFTHEYGEGRVYYQASY